jgi:methyl coenzyme M reductase subunit C-like uncharacterized protein (methanogenesis marker protein 7)
MQGMQDQMREVAWGRPAQLAVVEARQIGGMDMDVVRWALAEIDYCVVLLFLSSCHMTHVTCDMSHVLSGCDRASLANAHPLKLKTQL